MTDFIDTDLGGWDSSEEEGFRVDFSDREAEAEAFEATVMPAGWYRVAITEVTLEESKSAKNPGKPMFAVQVTVQGGDYKGRKLFDRWCLWEGALYSVSQALKAVGVDPKRGIIPPATWWMGKTMLAQVKVENKTILNEATNKYDLVDKDENNRPIKRNSVGGYKAIPANWDDANSPKSKDSKKAATKATINSLAP